MIPASFTDISKNPFPSMKRKVKKRSGMNHKAPGGRGIPTLVIGSLTKPLIFCLPSLP